MLALTFLVLFLGNFLTTLKVVHQKVQKNQDKVQKKDWEQNLSDTPQILPPASIFQHAQSLHRLTTVRSGRERTKLTALFLSGRDDSRSFRPAGFFASDDVCLSSMLLNSRSLHKMNSLWFSPVHSGTNVFCLCMCQCMRAFVQIMYNLKREQQTGTWFAFEDLKSVHTSYFCEVMMVKLSLAWTKLVDLALDLRCFLFVALISLLCHFTANQFIEWYHQTSHNVKKLHFCLSGAVFKDYKGTNTDMHSRFKAITVVSLSSSLTVTLLCSH